MDSWTKSGLALGCLAAGLTLINAVRNFAGGALTLGSAKFVGLVQSGAGICYYLAVTLLLTAISLKLRKDGPAAAPTQPAAPATPAQP